MKRVLALILGVWLVVPPLLRAQAQQTNVILSHSGGVGSLKLPANLKRLLKDICRSKRKLAKSH